MSDSGQILQDKLISLQVLQNGVYRSKFYTQVRELLLMNVLHYYRCRATYSMFR